MSVVKNVTRFFLFHDWIYSVIICFVVYWLVNLGPATLGDVGMSYFAINWIQPLISTAGIMAGLLAVMRIGSWFYFKKIHRYVWGHKYKDGNYHLFSQEDFKTLQPWQKLLLSFGVLSLLFAAGLIVFLRMLALAGSAPP